MTHAAMEHVNVNVNVNVRATACDQEALAKAMLDFCAKWLGEPDTRHMHVEADG